MQKYSLMPIIIIVFMVLISQPSSASGVSINATVDKNQATLEDYIRLTISVEGARGEPSLPSMPNFKVVSSGNSSRIQIINGQMTQSVDYSYLLYPKKTGVFTVGPATLTAQGKTFTSNTMTVTIQKTRSTKETNRDIFVTAEVDNNNPFIFEQIIYSFKFYRRVKVSGARLTDSPSFEGFITEDLGKEKEYQTIINGQAFLVTEIRQALFPIKAGTLEITPSTLQCDVVVKNRRQRGFFNDPFFDDSFFGFSRTEPKILRTPHLTITVRPLPKEGQPPDFNNLVGDFQLTSGLSSDSLEVGESTTLTLTLRGQGNLKGSQGITIGKLEHFKVYDDKPVFEPQIRNSRIGGNLIIKKALVPLQEGTFKIPSVAVPFFNPKSGQYEIARSTAHSIKAFPAQDKEKLHLVEAVGTRTSKETVKILGKDILPTHTSLKALSSERINPFSWITVTGFFTPIIVFMALLMAKQRQERSALDHDLLRKKNAYKNFSKKTSLLKKSLKDKDVSFYGEASKVMKDFIGDKLNITGSALTIGDCEQRLSSLQIKDEIMQELGKILSFLESGQFASQRHTIEEKEVILHSMKKVAKNLDKSIR